LDEALTLLQKEGIAILYLQIMIHGEPPSLLTNCKLSLNE
jgi:hypothetical protein